MLYCCFSCCGWIFTFIEYIKHYFWSILRKVFKLTSSKISLLLVIFELLPYLYVEILFASETCRDMASLVVNVVKFVKLKISVGYLKWF